VRLDGRRNRLMLTMKDSANASNSQFPIAPSARSYGCRVDQRSRTKREIRPGRDDPSRHAGDRRLAGHPRGHTTQVVSGSEHTTFVDAHGYARGDEATSTTARDFWRFSGRSLGVFFGGRVDPSSVPSIEKAIGVGLARAFTWHLVSFAGRDQPVQDSGSSASRRC